jgi:DinB superfamily
MAGPTSWRRCRRPPRTFRVLLDTATSAELRRGSDGTKWTNEQLLFHMLFGYLVVRRLRPFVRIMGRLPEGVSRVFAATLNAGTRPFHIVNYLGSLGGARVLGHGGMERTFDRIVNGLAASLLQASGAQLARGMHFPTGWDPCFRDYMTLADVYHYATQHYQHHRRQLALAKGHSRLTSPPTDQGGGEAAQALGSALLVVSSL